MIVLPADVNAHLLARHVDERGVERLLTLRVRVRIRVRVRVGVDAVSALRA